MGAGRFFLGEDDWLWDPNPNIRFGGWRFRTLEAAQAMLGQAA